MKLSRKKLRVIVSSDVKKIVSETIAVKELPRAYRTGVTILRNELTNYIVKNYQLK